MVIDRPYKDLHAVEQQLLMAQQRRDLHALQLQRHLEALKDRGHRGLLMKDAVHDLLHSFKPAEAISAALRPASGLAPLLMQLLTVGGSLKRRVLMTALSLAAPALLKRIDLGRLIHVVGGLLRSRKKAEQDGSYADTEDEVDFTEQWR